MTVTVRPMAESDLPACRDINRAAFSDFLGLPEPAAFRPGADVLGPRWRQWPEAGIVAERGGEPAGAGVLAHWGSVCVVGPVMVHPDHQGHGIARKLMDAFVPLFEAGKFGFVGLYTHVQSPLHVRLYEQYRFAMQRVTSIMSKAPETGPDGALEFSTIGADRQSWALTGMRAVAEALYPGFDAGREIRSLHDEGIGESLILAPRGHVLGFACCHHGAGSEATEGQVLVKFAAVAPGVEAADNFRHLLALCDGYAASRNADRIVAGTNAGRASAYRLMQQHGFRTDANGIAMMRPATDGYNRPNVFAIDDWR